MGHHLDPRSNGFTLGWIQHFNHQTWFLEFVPVKEYIKCWSRDCDGNDVSCTSDDGEDGDVV
jgi:hypothetical protein